MMKQHVCRKRFGAGLRVSLISVMALVASVIATLAVTRPAVALPTGVTVDPAVVSTSPGTYVPHSQPVIVHEFAVGAGPWFIHTTDGGGPSITPLTSAHDADSTQGEVWNGLRLVPLGNSAEIAAGTSSWRVEGTHSVTNQFATPPQATMVQFWICAANGGCGPLHGGSRVEIWVHSVASLKTAGSPPWLSSAEVATSGTSLSLIFDETLASSVPNVGDIAVEADGVSVPVTSITNSGSTSVLALGSAIAQGATVTVAYAAPATGGFADTESTPNRTVTFPAQMVTNNSTMAVDTTAPALASGTAPSLAANGTTLTLTFDEALASATPPASAFTIVAGGSAVSVSSVANSGSTSVLTLGTAVAQGTTVTVAYTAPQSGGLQDAAGNLTATFTAQAVTNNSTVASPSSAGGSSGSTTTTVPASSSGGGSSGTASTAAPSIGSTTPTRITADNQKQFAAAPGAAKAIVNGVEVTVSITNASDDRAGSTDPGDRSPEQVAELQDTADTIVTVLDKAAGGDSGLAVVDTETGAEIDGIFDDVRVPVEDVIVAEAGDFAGLYASRDENGNPVKIQADSLEMERGGEVAVIVYGLPAGEDVELVLMSTPYLLGTVTTDSTGGFTRMVGPPASVLAGDHTLVTASDTVTVSLGIRITDPTAGLPATGSPVPLGLIVMLIGCGVLMVMGSRRPTDTTK